MDYAREAVSQGLKEIGFADHFPMFYLPELPYDDYSMDLEELPAYMKDIEEAGRAFSGRMEIKAGVEVDYLKTEEATLKRAISTQEFDYLTGVTHFIDGWIIDDTRNVDKYVEYDLDKLYRRYFDEMEVAMKSGLFDVVGHIDVIKRFNYIPDAGVEQYILPFLDLIAERDLCVEVNTSGLERPVRDSFPGLNLFNTMYERGIQVTLGSDAHDPKEVGRHFKTVLKALKKAGYTKLVSFKKREKTLKTIRF